MRKLRIPTYLSSHLPSIRKYAPSLSDGKPDIIDLSNDPDEIVMQVSFILCSLLYLSLLLNLSNVT